jgi:hypothetical protein
MGQNLTNPIARAAKRGELSKADRTPVAKTPPFTLTLIVPGVDYHGRTYAVRQQRRQKKGGTTLARMVSKLRGKAAVKAAKRARHAARKAA